MAGGSRQQELEAGGKDQKTKVMHEEREVGGRREREKTWQKRTKKRQKYEEERDDVKKEYRQGVGK